MLGIGNYFWRLIPANPILLRVVEGGSKRRRDLIIRCAYLGLLILVVILSVLSATGNGAMGLDTLAGTSARLFQQMSYLQLGLVALLAPIFTAGAITQEKDSQTYDILLSTPLTNGQIILGSLLSRLFFVIALLISGIPVFSITQMFGGVAISAIFRSFMISAATAFVTGALAMAIATFKVGTRRTIFSFYLFIVIYLIGGMLLDRLPYFHRTFDPLDHHATDTSILTAFHPFLALRSIFNEPNYLPADYGSLPDSLKTWPIGWALSSPASFYCTFMFTLSLVLVLPAIVALRRVAQSTLSLKSWLFQKLHLSTGDRTQKPRPVWTNPIAWREARTKASAARASLLRYGFISLGLLGAFALAYAYGTPLPVDRYVTAHAYDAGKSELFISRTGNPTEVFLVRPGLTAVTFNGKPADLSVLTRKLALSVPPSVDTAGRKLITSLDLVEMPRRISADQTRSLLLGAVLVEVAVILLIVTNAAASTVTREKEDGTLDLLLSTPITSRYYIWGKLWGLVSFVLPLIAVPVLSVAIFVIWDLIRLLSTDDSQFRWIVFPESILVMPATLTIVVAFAAILGMQMSLRLRKTVMAVMTSLGIVVGVCATLGWCGFTMLSNSGSQSSFLLVIGSFSPFTLLTLMLDPYHFGGRIFENEADVVAARVLILAFGYAAAAAYALVVWSMYKSMVKNFDMTIRKQSR
ncbi:MAG TPA: ABC transporter permease subunit [Tepidisphaeraceae bacterium]|jgi:ABC-type transport system involved in multi-copper enzyme maturation permease subunit|nr:ABC transporter permease subunit [Tepidisphaeraceae bacterium]